MSGAASGPPGLRVRARRAGNRAEAKGGRRFARKSLAGRFA